MNFTNINDPAGVSALLDQLRASQAWADLQGQSSQPQGTSSSGSQKPPSTPEVPPLSAIPSSSLAASSLSVASLLSQLSSTSNTGNSQPYDTTPSSSGSLASLPSLPSYGSPAETSSQPFPSPPTLVRRNQDVRGYTFQQSLPHLARLSEDSAFKLAIATLRKDQEDLEKQLWEERRVIHDKQAEKVKVAVTKANMLGIGISEREANAMKENFERELQRFDKERVLPAWGGLVTRQQAALEVHGVPSMFVTNTGSDRERQQRVIQVLEGITSPEESVL